MCGRRLHYEKKILDPAGMRGQHDPAHRMRGGIFRTDNCSGNDNCSGDDVSGRSNDSSINNSRNNSGNGINGGNGG